MRIFFHVMVLYWCCYAVVAHMIVPVLFAGGKFSFSLQKGKPSFFCEVLLIWPVLKLVAELEGLGLKM